ncbi:hypothetical protein GCM10011316_24270 [Roseibium aquae]|uniref:Uncharacterized protein n=2 Tax=Roseibium aquae TaxID=1323746 RepID=A0A916X2C0_9HYPH|nr:hypothetical protein GCM10011316_24270 [Roseibium aquae]
MVRSQESLIRYAGLVIASEQMAKNMSEQKATPAPQPQSGTKLENRYKPVGIAAVNAAAICTKGAGYKIVK